jgi:hypothetical protein
MSSKRCQIPIKKQSKWNDRWTKNKQTWRDNDYIYVEFLRGVLPFQGTSNNSQRCLHSPGTVGTLCWTSPASCENIKSSRDNILKLLSGAIMPMYYWIKRYWPEPKQLYINVIIVLWALKWMKSSRHRWVTPKVNDTVHSWNRGFTF